MVRWWIDGGNGGDGNNDDGDAAEEGRQLVTTTMTMMTSTTMAAAATEARTAATQGSIGNPLIEGAYFSVFRRTTTKLNSLYHPPLRQGWYKLLPMSTPWAGAKK